MPRETGSRLDRVCSALMHTTLAAHSAAATVYQPTPVAAALHAARNRLVTELCVFSDHVLIEKGGSFMLAA
jgi:hypothetical protein